MKLEISLKTLIHIQRHLDRVVHETNDGMYATLVQQDLEALQAAIARAAALLPQRTL